MRMCIHIHTNNRSALKKRHLLILTWTSIRSVTCWWLLIVRTRVAQVPSISRATIIRIYCNHYLRQYQVEHQTIERVELGGKKKSKFSKKRCVGWRLRTRGPSIAGFLPIMLAHVTESTVDTNTLQQPEKKTPQQQGGTRCGGPFPMPPPLQFSLHCFFIFTEKIQLLGSYVTGTFFFYTIIMLST